MEDIDIIDLYKDMKSIRKICEELQIDYSNLMNRKTSKENNKKVVDKIKIEVLKIYSVLKIMEG